VKTADKYTRRRVAAALEKHGVDVWEGGTVKAELNHGRWIAECPCNGAEFVEPGKPMICGSCGAVHKVEFPRNRPKLEGLLVGRPVANQNWKPGESATDLEAENVLHGVRS